MDDQTLDHLLAQRRKVPLPSLSPTFQQGVLRKIRQCKAEANGHRGTWLEWLLEPIFKPTTAFAALSLALVLGVGLGTTTLADSRNTQTRLALDLQVFGSSSPSLSTTLMGYTK